MKRALTLVLAVAAWGCGSKPPAMSNKPAGLYGSPAQLAFTCVTPGCDKTITTTITVNGNRRLAIKRVLIEGDVGGDFTATPSQEAPFVIGPGSTFTVDVEYKPKGAPAPGAIGLHVTYTDASPDESPDRAMPGELVVPLIRRVVGQPLLAVSPATLSFGAVLPGAKKTMPIRAENVGFGNVTLELAQPDSGTPDIIFVLPPDHSFGADGGIDVPVTFKPTSSEYLSTDIAIPATYDTVAPAILHVEATSLSSPQLGVEPQALIDFGEVPKGQSRTNTVQLVNQGGAELDVMAPKLTDATGNLSLSAADAGWTLMPLQRGPMTITLNGRDAGEVQGLVRLTSNDPGNPYLDVTVKGTVTEPQATVNPTSIDFGTVPQGWVVTKTINVKNTGYGSLKVKSLQFVAGSSMLFTLTNIPALPATLARDQQLAVDVQFRAETQAMFTAQVSVESDDPVNNFVTANIKGTVGDCNTGCPITNGTPSCTGGVCSVGTCNVGWYDTDGQAADGCECQEIGNDPGEFCMGAQDLGTLNDEDGDSTTYQGLIPTADDVDLIRFFGNDQTGFFSDAYDVRIRLDSADPGISMCVYKNGGHQSDCFFSNQACPQNRYYEDDGSFGTDDSSDYIIKVYRTMSTAPTCTSYTIFASNG
ncbi:MAG: choice-of-anchor D domain-containing protein [Myxococcaceae bacterium]